MIAMLREAGRTAASRVAATLVVTCLTVLMSGLVGAPGNQGHAASETSPPAEPAFVSTTVCAECHAKEHKAWQKSHHSWALRRPTPENVLGDFNNVTFEHHGVRSKFYRRGESFFIETDGPDGKPAEFEIKYTIGVTPLQQYLVELDKGRLQALDIAWDTQQKRWFHLYPGQKLEPGNGLHWSGPYKNWQTRCAECHQTNFVKGFAPRTGSYQSKWSELTIGCEACHGPGEAHVRWARDPAAFQSKKPDSVDDQGLAVSFPLKSAKDEIRLCAPCHSRRSPLGADAPPPGSEFADHYKLALLREGLYHADGQIDEEVYVYGSFLQSRMYARGVRCSNCHEPHTGELRAEGNAVCTQCHAPAGNTDFPTLKKSAYDDPSHHHHKVDSEGAKCVSCHMQAKTYMEVDPRRDHSFRVPRPDLSAKLESPDACTGCHQDKKAAWAVSKVKAWFPEGRSGTPHFGEIFRQGRTRPGADTGQKLVALAVDSANAAIVRASALDLLRASMTPALVARIVPLLQAKDTLIREAALRLLDSAPPALRIKLVTPLLRDSAKAVRLEAARLLIGVPLDGLSSEDKAAARTEISAYQRSLFSRADFPETQMQIAGLAMVLRDFGTAQKAFLKALSMDPQLTDAWLTLAQIQSALRQPGRARKTLEQAAQKIPDSAIVQYRLGALYSSLREHGKAVASLEKSLKLGGSSPDLFELLATGYLVLGELEKARANADDLARKYPGHRPGPLVRQLLQMPLQR